MNRRKKEKNPLWGGRFSGPPSEISHKFSSSLELDKRLYKEDIKGSIAYSKALLEAHVISRSEFKKIKNGLVSIEKQIDKDKFNWENSLEDVHMNIEMALYNKIGLAAKKIHTGRSRNDQISTDVRMFVKLEIDNSINAILKLQKAILTKSSIHTETMMPGFTHLQIAQPVTLGHHLMSWYEMLERDLSRLEDAKKRTDCMPLGSAALAGSRFIINRKKLAKELGFSKISKNSIDAVSDRDFIIELCSSISIIGNHLSRIAEELILWSSSQFNYIDLDERFCTGSSIMPQKKNPDIAELIRGGSSKTIANLIGLLSLMKSLPLSYNRDMQEDKAFMFSSLDYLEPALSLTAEMIKTMKVNKENMKKDCFKGQITATDLADYLVNKSVPFRDSHEIVGNIVAHAEDRSQQIFELTLDELKNFSKKIDQDVFRFIDPEYSVKSKAIFGGTSPKEVKKQIKIAKRKFFKKNEAS